MAFLHTVFRHGPASHRALDVVPSSLALFLNKTADASNPPLVVLETAAHPGCR